MKRISIFLALTILFSLPWWWLARQHGGYGYITLLMWSPGLAGMATLLATGGKLGDLGWRGAHLGWVAAAGLVVLLMVCLPNLAVWAARLVAFPDQDGLDQAIKLTAMPKAALPLMIIWYGVLVSTAGMVRLAGPALGEEIGWRGFLVPEACGSLGFVGGSLLVGLAWALWHFPLMIGKASPVALANFTVTIVGMNFAYSWFRLKSNSIWPTVVMHGLHNALLTSFFVKLSATGPSADTWLDETGFALPIAGLAVGLVFLVLGRRLTTAPTDQADDPLQTA